MATPQSGKRSRTPHSRPSTYQISQPSTGRAATSSRARTYTPSSRARTATKHGDEVVVAVIENNISEVGVCAYNLNGFDVELRQLADSKTFTTLLTTLTVFDVVEIIMSVTSANGPMETALNTHRYTRDIKETSGAIEIARLSVKVCPHLSPLTNSPYYLALASCNALLKHIQHVNNMVFQPHSLRIKFSPNEDKLYLDMQTIEGLELLQNGRPEVQGSSERIQGSLLHVLDKTKTRAGRRLLRRSLLEPSTDRASIKNRQDSVEELTQMDEVYFNVTSVLTKFPDIEQALVALTAKENRIVRRGGPSNRSNAPVVGKRVVDETRKPCMTIIRAVLTIKDGLEAAGELHDALRGTKTPLLCMAAKTIKVPLFDRLKGAISDVIVKEAQISRDLETMRLQGAFAVKCGLNGKLDVSRQILCDIMKSMQELRDELAEQYELNDLKLALSNSRGYHFTYSTKGLDSSRIPRVFHSRTNSKDLHRFTTTNLSSFNMRYFDVLNEIWQLTDSELQDLLDVIFEPGTALALYYLCDSIAIIDLVSSFVTYCSTSEVKHTRPLMTRDGPTLIVRSAHHPILHNLHPGTSVPNNMLVDIAAALQIITGENNAGKSTIIKMIGLLVIMAHTGCSVPAERATFRVMDSILSRFTTSDEITVGHSHSHFGKEMSEMAAILDHISVNSDLKTEEIPPGTTIPWDPSASHIDGEKQFLLLIDELGRSTSTIDGFSIAYAMLEEFACTRGVFTLFATHFLGLTALEKVYPNIRSYHMATREPPTPITAPLLPSTGGDASTDNTRTTPSSARAPVVQSEYTYTIKEGALAKRSYGIETARAAGFPEEVVQDAEQLKERMSLARISDPEAFAATHYTKEDMERAHRALGNLLLLRRIEHIKAQSKDDETMLRRLKRFQKEVREAMNLPAHESSNAHASSTHNPTSSGRSTDEARRNSSDK